MSEKLPRIILHCESINTAALKNINLFNGDVEENEANEKRKEGEDCFNVDLHLILKLKQLKSSFKLKYLI